MTDFHIIVKGSRHTKACQHWQGICHIIYYYPLFWQQLFLNWTDFSPTFRIKWKMLHWPLLLFILSGDVSLCMWLVVKATLQSKGCCSGAYRCPQNSRANFCLLTLPRHSRLCTDAVVYILNNRHKRWTLVWSSILHGNGSTNGHVPIHLVSCIAHINDHLIAMAILEKEIYITAVRLK